MGGFTSDKFTDACTLRFGALLHMHVVSIFKKAKKKIYLHQFVHLLSNRKLKISSQKQQVLCSPSPILIYSRYPGMELILNLVYEKGFSKNIIGKRGQR